MRSARTLTAVIALLALAATPALATTPVSVPGGAGWVSTGIEVTAGQTVSLESHGSIHTAPIPDFHNPGVFKSASGPEGQVDGDLCGDVTDGFPPGLIEITGPCALDDAYFGELIGRIGDTVFRIGDAESFVAPATGTLELATNDLTLTYFDNVGAFTVLFR
jgi:hypothetical protein